MEIQKPKIEQDRTTAKKKLLLAALPMALGVIKQACKIAGINKDTYYEWRKNDPEFIKQINNAFEGYFMQIKKRSEERSEQERVAFEAELDIKAHSHHKKEIW